MTKSKQDWTPGSLVKIGFLKLTVVRPSVCGWIVKAANGTTYEFQPHAGLYRTDSVVA